jgi:multidrug efflux pump subunit AcrB
MDREESAHGHRRGWSGTLLWALLIVASVVLIFMGLRRTTFFI